MTTSQAQKLHCYLDHEGDGTSDHTRTVANGKGSPLPVLWIDGLGDIGPSVFLDGGLDSLSDGHTQRDGLCKLQPQHRYHSHECHPQSLERFHQRLRLRASQKELEFATGQVFARQLFHLS